MRFVSLVRSNRTSWGVLAGTEVLDLGSVLGTRAPALRAALALHDFRDAVDAALNSSPRHPLASVSLGPVIPDAGKILCVGLNYETHRKETGRSEVDNPTIFTRFADTHVGHGTPIVCPRVSKD